MTKNNFSLVGILVTLLVALLPQWTGVPVPSTIQAGLMALGAGIYGFCTHEQHPLGNNMLSTLAGIIPCLLWIVTYVFHLTISAAIQTDVTYGVLVIIAIISDTPDKLKDILAQLGAKTTTPVPDKIEGEN